MKRNWYIVDTNEKRVFLLTMYHEDGTESKAVVTNSSVKQGTHYHTRIDAHVDSFACYVDANMFTSRYIRSFKA